MNTQVGKSVGIALLLAAGLIAALFAMGVFAPAGVDAGGIKGGSKAPEVTLSKNEPSASDVTMTIIFEVNEEVDGTNPNDVRISIPIGSDGATATAFGVPSGFASTATAPSPNVSVRQGNANVGSVTVLGNTIDTIVIGVPASDSGRINAELGSPITVMVTGLSNPTGAISAPIMIGQEDGTDGTYNDFDADRATSDVEHAMAKVFEPLTGVSASVDKPGVDEMGVTMTLTFTSPLETPSDVVITLPMLPEYDVIDSGGIIDTCGTSEDEACYAITNLANATLTYVDGSTASPATGDTITVSAASISTDDEFEIKIGTVAGATASAPRTGGLANPDNSMAVPITFKQGSVDPDITETIYFTDRNQISLARPEAGKRSTLYPADAKAEDVTMTLRFESVVAVDDDTKILVDLHDDFGGFSTGNITVMQDDEDDVAQTVSTATRAPGTNAFYISKAASGDNVGMGEVTVTITDLTNPDTVGTVSSAIIVKQGEFAAVGATFRLQGAEISTETPGADVRVEISTGAGTQIPGGDDITVTLEGFGIPDTIEDSDVIIQTNRNTNPSDVSVSGSTVTLSLPTTVGDSVEPYNIGTGSYSIVFKQGAGLTNPTSGGDKTITVSDMDDDPHEMTVTISSSVSVKPTFVTRGEDATVTAKGLRDGTATVYLMDGKSRGLVLGSGTADDGVVEIAIDTSDSDILANATKDKDGGSDDGVNILSVVDANDDEVGQTMLGIKPTIKLGSDSAKLSKSLEISVSDWYYGTITKDRVTFGGIPATSISVDGDTVNSVNVGDDKKDTFTATVPGNARTGEQEVKVAGSNPRGLKTYSITATVTIDALALDISPSTVVPGSQITITGSGFQEDTNVSEILIGDAMATLPERDDRESTSAGRIAYTVEVPDTVGDGDLDVKVTVGTGDDARVGVGSITVPEPSITLSPAESVPGSVISVTGSGFDSGGRVEVMYNNEVEEVGRADSGGEFHIRLEIPSDAGVDETNDVKVESRSHSGINATAEHKTPGPAITVPEEAQVGSLITVSGSNFEVFSTLDVKLGGKDATPTPSPETDKNGEFEIEVRVPRLDAGSHTITIEDGSDNSVTETFTVVTTAVVSTPQEVFDVLGENLKVVWRYNNADQSWAAYDPSLPAELNDLPGVSRGDIVWVELREAATFQGDNLIAGWSLVSLE